MDTAWLIDWEHGRVCHSKHNESDLSDCILLQFTGVKDKDNKDIYDGNLITGGGLLVPFELYWNTPSSEWWVKRGDDEGWKIDLSCSKRYEVVGNKFEDKHPLEGDAV